MSSQSWQELLVASQVDGTALTNTVTPTSLLGAAGAGAAHAKQTFPANYWQIQKKLRVKVQGRISTLVTAPGTFTFDLRLGAVVIANAGAASLNIVAKTNVPFWLEWELTCRAVGSGTAANFMHQAKLISEAVIGAPIPTVGGVGVLLLPVVTPAVGTGFDATAAQTLDLFGTWSVANAANSIQVHQFAVEVPN